MKKDRDCNMAYPVYPQMIPNYGGMVMPGQMIPMPGASGNFIGTDLSNINNQINSLEQRITRLENMISKNNYNTYNSSNYQMM